MPTICKAYLFVNGDSKEYLINFINLPAFINLHRDVYEMILVGPFDRQFVLHVKKGKIVFCSDSIVLANLEKEIKLFKKEMLLNLQLYSAFVGNRLIEKVYAFSTSQQQAFLDIQQWSMATPKQMFQSA